MGISLREWLIIGGVLIVILILVDGWRRVSASRSRLKLEIDRTLSELGEGEPQQHNPELPNGGARKRSHEQAAEARSSAAGARRKRVEPSIGQSESAEDESPELAEIDPLFDDVPAREKSPSRNQSGRHGTLAAETGSAGVHTAGDKGHLKVVVSEQPSRTVDADLQIPGSEHSAESAAADDQVADDSRQPIPTLFDRLGKEPLSANEPETGMKPAHPDSAQAVVVDTPDAETAADKRRTAGVETYVETVELSAQELFELSEKATVTKMKTVVDEQGFDLDTDEDEPAPAPAPVATQPKRQGPTLSAPPEPEHVLVITVVARNGERLPGKALDRIVTACGMDWGAMSIYHRAEDNEPGAPVQFSMANAVAPGTFDPNRLEELETPAVSFFMSMNEPKDPMTAYECMLATAETLAKHLNGDLLDEDRSVMRPQTKEHYRERIREFQMHQRQRRAN